MKDFVSKVEFHPSGFITNVYTTDGRIISYQKAILEHEEGSLGGLEESDGLSYMKRME